MLFQILEYWEIAIDGIQIILCLLILLFLIRTRRMQNQLVAKRGKNDFAPNFNVEVFTQTIKQHIEQAFSNIIGTITSEKCNLERTLQAGLMKAESHSISGLQPLSWSSNSQESSRAYSDFIAADDRLLQIRKLATKGVSIQQISEELKIPKGEVELILSVEKGGIVY